MFWPHFTLVYQSGGEDLSISSRAAQRRETAAEHESRLLCAGKRRLGTSTSAQKCCRHVVFDVPDSDPPSAVDSKQEEQYDGATMDTILVILGGFATLGMVGLSMRQIFGRENAATLTVQVVIVGVLLLVLDGYRHFNVLLPVLLVVTLVTGVWRERQRRVTIPTSEDELDAARFFENASNTVIQSLSTLNESSQLPPEQQRLSLLETMRTWQEICLEQQERQCPAGMEEMWHYFSNALQILGSMAETLTKLYEDPVAVARLENLRLAIQGGAQIDPRQQTEVQLYQSTMRRLQDYNRELDLAQKAWKRWSKNRVVAVAS